MASQVPKQEALFVSYFFWNMFGPVQCFLSAAGEGREGHWRMLYADLKTGERHHILVLETGRLS